MSGNDERPKKKKITIELSESDRKVLIQLLVEHLERVRGDINNVRK